MIVIQMKVWITLIFIGCATGLDKCIETIDSVTQDEPTCDVIQLNDQNHINILCNENIGWGSFKNQLLLNYTFATTYPVNSNSDHSSTQCLTLERVSIAARTPFGYVGQVKTTVMKAQLRSQTHTGQVRYNSSCINDVTDSQDVSKCVHGLYTTKLIDIIMKIFTIDVRDTFTNKSQSDIWETLTVSLYEDSLIWPVKYFKLLSDHVVDALYLNNNAFGQIKSGAFPAFPHVQLLDLSWCSLSSIAVTSLDNMTNLRHLNLAGNLLIKLPDALLKLSKLETLNLSSNHARHPFIIYPSALSRLSNLKHLDISWVNADIDTTTEDHAKSIMRSLITLNLTVSTYFPTQFIRLFPNLEVLILSHRQCIVVVDDGDGSASISEKLGSEYIHSMINSELKHLRILDLSEQRTNEDGQSIYVNLANKNIKRFHPINVSHDLNHSHILNLRGNKIETWTEEMLRSNATLNLELDLTKNDIKDVSEAMIKDFSKLKAVNLSGNPFDCGQCSLWTFLDWLNTNNTTTDFQLSPYKCAFPKATKGRIISNATLPQHCFPKPIENRMVTIVIPIICVVLVFIVIGPSLVYCRRRQAKLKPTQTECVQLNPNVWYDAFVSYCSEDRDWVLEQLIPQVEQREPRLHLCIHERDFFAGGTIINNVIECIDNSRKTLFLITRRFIRSNWCQWELEMAQHKLFEEGNDVLVLVMLEEVAKKDLPRLLQILVATRTYLQWPCGDTCTQDDYELFWSRLRHFIGPCNCIKEQLQQAGILW